MPDFDVPSGGERSPGQTAARPGAAAYNATVVGRVELAPGLVILDVLPDRVPFTFTAGQYVVLGLKRSAPRIEEAEVDHPRGESPGAEDGALPAGREDPDQLIRRAYSLASSSKTDEYLEFYLTLVPSGELTPRLFALGLRDRLFVGPKAAGVFTLDRVPAGHDVLLVGTGTGLAPYMSMLRSELICGGPRRFIVLHGARFSWDLGYRAELNALARHCHNLIYLPVVSRPQEDPTWTGLGGYLQDVLVSGLVEQRSGLPLDPEHLHVFLCGNPGMIEAAKVHLVARGFQPDVRGATGTMHMEEYW